MTGKPGTVPSLEVALREQEGNVAVIDPRCAQAYGLFEQGLTTKNAAKTLKVRPETVTHWRNEWEKRKKQKDGLLM
jgi:hypothetical protein